MARDRYGRRGLGRAALVVYDAEELALVDFRHVGDSQLLSLATLAYVGLAIGIPVITFLVCVVGQRVGQH